MKFANLDSGAVVGGLVAAVVITLLWKMGSQDAAFFILTVLSMGTFIRSYSKK